MRKGPRILAGDYAGQTVDVINNSGIRPTSERVRRSLFDIIEPLLTRRVFIDICSGSGIMGIEALSRGADQCLFIDKNRNTCHQLQRLIRRFDVASRARVVCGPAETVCSDLIARQEEVILFIDPPYNENLTGVILERIAEKSLQDRVCLGAVEHHHKTTLSIDTISWSVSRTIRYGETQITFIKPAKYSGLGDSQ